MIVAGVHCGSVVTFLTTLLGGGLLWAMAEISIPVRTGWSSLHRRFIPVCGMMPMWDVAWSLACIAYCCLLLVL